MGALKKRSGPGRACGRPAWAGMVDRCALTQSQDRDFRVASRPDWMAAQGVPWACHDKTPVYDNPWIAVHDCKTTAPTGHAAQYGLIHFKNRAIGVLPLFEDGDTLLVGQHRFPAGDYSWELPEGGGPLDEDPLETARRELREETGFDARDWVHALAFQLSNSVTDEHGHGYLAFGLTEAGAAPDETEDLRTRRLPFRQAMDLMARGLLPDMITQALLLRAYHLAREGALPPALAQAMLGG
jgi:8-oxo-dGTP pyrophosphatase MutT (NUDIX family)